MPMLCRIGSWRRGRQWPDCESYPPLCGSVILQGWHPHSGGRKTSPAGPRACARPGCRNNRGVLRGDLTSPPARMWLDPRRVERVRMPKHPAAGHCRPRIELRQRGFDPPRSPAHSTGFEVRLCRAAPAAFAPAAFNGTKRNECQSPKVGERERNSQAIDRLRSDN